MTIDLKRLLFAVVSLCGLALSGCSSSPSSSATSPAHPGTSAGTVAPPSTPAVATADPPASQASGDHPADGANPTPADPPGAESMPPQGGGDSNACTTQCRTDDDCACGTDAQTGACAFGNKSCIDTSRQCPDFCTGFNGKRQLRCEQQICTLR